MKTKNYVAALLFCLAFNQARATIIVGGGPGDKPYHPGITTLLIGTPASNGTVELSGYILRTQAEQEASLARFDAFPAGTLDSSKGIVIILRPLSYTIADHLNSLGLTVGNLGALDNWNPAGFVGVVGMDGPDELVFGGGNFIDQVGIAGAPVSFYVQNYNPSNIYVNSFITQAGLGAGYRLGFVTEPSQPFTTPENGSALFLFLIGLAALYWKKAVV